jgi:hypothetical protein
MLKKIICLAVVLGLASSASALVIDSEVTWSERTAIHAQEGGGIEVTGTGKLTINGRVDIDSPGWLLIRSGGVFIQAENSDGFKLPDNDEGAPGPSVTIEGGGYMECLNTESIGERLYDGGVFIGLSGRYVTGLDGSDRRDPRTAEWKITPIGLATGYEITVEGDVATIHGTPEPATIALLGVGALALIRRKR